MTRTAFGRILMPTVQAPGIDSLYYFLFSASDSLHPAVACVFLPHVALRARFLQPCHRFVAIIVLPDSFSNGARTGETVEFDLLGLKDPTMIGPILPETNGE